MQDLPAIQKQIANDGGDLFRLSPREFATFMDNKWTSGARS